MVANFTYLLLLNSTVLKLQPKIKFQHLWSLKRPVCLATLKSCDTTKQSVDKIIYAPFPEVVHSSEEINDCHPRNGKLFKRIEHSGIR